MARWSRCCAMNGASAEDSSATCRSRHHCRVASGLRGNAHPSSPLKKLSKSNELPIQHAIQIPICFCSRHLCASSLQQVRSALPTCHVPTPIPPGSTLVIGFLGGYERWNDEHRSVRRLVLKLRARNGIFAESISNHNQKVALNLIRRALDTNRDGKLDAAERARARVILFGQSWGGAATHKHCARTGQAGCARAAYRAGGQRWRARQCCSRKRVRRRKFLPARSTHNRWARGDSRSRFVKDRDPR